MLKFIREPMATSAQNMSIKFFDLAYNIQYFDEFLSQELIIKDKEAKPMTVSKRNKRFIELITYEIENVRENKFSQSLNFRVMNSFYGGFWEVIFYELFNQEQQPKKEKFQ